MRSCNSIFPKHDWDKWDIIGNYDILRKDDSLIGKEYHQKRKCKICGKTEFNKQTIL